MGNKVVAIVSGGMDSVTVLHHYHWKKLGQVSLGLSFNYGSTHNAAEIPYAKWHCEKLGIPHKVIDLTFLAKDFKSSALTNRNIPIPEGHYSDDKMRVTVVPARNMIMLSMAAGYAEDRGAGGVIIGSHLGDRAQYPDCREEFTAAISLAAMLGTYGKIKIISPFNLLTKKEILEIGLKLDVDYAHTNSCYRGDAIACMGACSTCMERIEAFIQVGVRDPIYSQEQWGAVKEKCIKIAEKFEAEGR